MKKKSLYKFVTAASLAGFLWLAFAIQTDTKDYQTEVSLCLFKHATSIPCPSCGSTRSAVAFLNGDMQGVFAANPVGTLLLLPMLVFPLWILYDAAARKSSFYRFYQKTEQLLNRNWLIFSLLSLIAANWLWNISKGL